jgi:hypothetical protein
VGGRSWPPAARRRGSGEDVWGGAVSDDLAVGQHDNAVGDDGGQLDVVGGHGDRMPGGGEISKHADQPVLGGIVQPAVGSSRRTTCG